MKILLSFIFSIALLAGVSAQTAPVNQVSTINFSVPDADRGIEIPNCLFERIAKHLQVESLTFEYLFTTNQGIRIYRYTTEANEVGYISVTNLSCLAVIKFADDPNDLFYQPKLD